MVNAPAAPSPLQRIRIASRILLGVFFAYCLIYFLLLRPHLTSPDAVADRYVRQIQYQDWREIARMHLHREDGEVTAGKLKRLVASLGPVRSAQNRGSQLLTVPLLTRAYRLYDLNCDKGQVQLRLVLEPSWGTWKVAEAHPFFNPPMPFSMNSPMRNGGPR